MEKKKIRVYKHPYMWEVDFTFGTLEQMIENRESVTGQYTSSFHLYFGGSFNKEMNSTNRAPLVLVGAEIGVNKRTDYWREVDVTDISSVKCIQSCMWEGTYFFLEELNEFIKQGLYPINVDWNGVTYIEDGYYDKNHRYQISYRKTDTYRY